MPRGALPIEKDPAQGDLDKYGRVLAYVYRSDGLFYNEYMVKEGYAHEYTYNIPYKYQADFKAAQNDARTKQRGLWSPDACNGDTEQAADPETTVKTAPNDSYAYYASSYRTSKYYYPASCSAWQGLSEKYLRGFTTLPELLSVFPTHTLSPQCQE